MAIKTPISIYCRIKPRCLSNENEMQAYTINRGSEKETITISSKQIINNVVNNKPDVYNFQFEKVFDQLTSQEEIYASVAQPVVQSALKGYNGTIFAYGQTGSGKTHTISGNEESPGIVPRALEEIFAAVNNAKDGRYEVHMSYLEIYNEHTNDLLAPQSDAEEKKKIWLGESGEKVMEWHNLILCTVASLAEAIALLAVGDNNRIVCDTPMNVFSSRSHTILSIHLTVHLNDSPELRRAKLNLVDLAGSERVHKTQEEGLILEEARHINLSLHFLEQVIVALSDSWRTHVPYRNCTLTSALRDSLGGNCKTVMVANVAIDKANVEETVSTCRFAQRVALVRNEPTLNSERDLAAENSHLRSQIQELQEQCSSLQAQVRRLEQRELVVERLASLQSVAVGDAPANTGGLSVQQLQTDIIYLIGWLQDELKAKHQGQSPECPAYTPSLSTGEGDGGFDSFVASMKAEEDWVKAKEAEQKAANALTNKMDIIKSVHQDILEWWKQHEKSLVKEMLSGSKIDLPGSDAEPLSQLSVDSLLNTHSDLLKDFQLLKSRLQSSKRSLERIKRKYFVEYSSWRKSEKSSSESLVDKGETSDKVFLFEKEGNFDTEIPNLEYAEDEMEICEVIKKNSEKNISNYLKNFTWDDGELLSEKSFSLNDSDLNTLIGDMNDSVFSTSTTLYENRIPRPGEGSQTNERSPQLPDCRLTGDPDIDREIIAFYQNKYLN